MEHLLPNYELPQQTQTQESKMDAILANHAKWLADPSTGKRADLRGTNLRWVNLRGADLSGADLRWADLRGTNLRWADLRWANLREADLRDADLRGANLRGADLREANLNGAYLREAGGIVLCGQPDGWLAYAYLREGVAYVRVGCRCFTFAEARSYWAGKDHRREVLAAVDYMATIAKLRGWPV